MKIVEFIEISCSISNVRRDIIHCPGNSQSSLMSNKLYGSSIRDTLQSPDYWEKSLEELTPDGVTQSLCGYECREQGDKGTAVCEVERMQCYGKQEIL